MIILGISCFYHDSAACIIKDGEIVAAAAEERFTRIKHDNTFPVKSINFCLDYLGIAANEVDIVTFYEKPIVKFERIISQHLNYFPKSWKVYKDTMESWLNKKLQIRKLLQEHFQYHGVVEYVPHHLSHAAGAYYLSGFQKSAIVTIDGVGEWATTNVGLGLDNKISIYNEIKFPHSLGLLYSAITAYLGFKVNNSEYEVMGLASYGDPRPFSSKFDELLKIHPNGSYELNMKYFDYGWSDHMFSNGLTELFGHPPRLQNEKIERHHENIAASLQQKFEKAVFGILNFAYAKYKTKNLCLSGGSALNSVMNGKIVNNTPFRNIFVSPDPGDGGGAMGAALYTAVHNMPFKRPASLSPYLGPDFSWYRIENVLKKNGLKYSLIKNRAAFLKRVANYIKKRKVVGWFQGRMEWGPRALGARSILASASDQEMRDLINSKVKKRDMFRPFAPVILDNYVKSFFETDKQPLNLGKFMLIVLPFKKRGFREVPATVHVDGSGRLQSIARKDNPLYYDLVKTYMDITGTPVFINTSFNVKGEPIVCTPQEAINCFLATEIDVLIMDQYIVTK